MRIWARALLRPQIPARNWYMWVWWMWLQGPALYPCRSALEHLLFLSAVRYTDLSIIVGLCMWLKLVCPFVAVLSSRACICTAERLRQYHCLHHTALLSTAPHYQVLLFVPSNVNRVSESAQFQSTSTPNELLDWRVDMELPVLPFSTCSVCDWSVLETGDLGLVQT